MRHENRAEQIISNLLIKFMEPVRKMLIVNFNEVESRARESEREECAKLAENFVMSDGDHGTEIAQAIRERR